MGLGQGKLAAVLECRGVGVGGTPETVESEGDPLKALAHPCPVDLKTIPVTDIDQPAGYEI